MNKISDFADSPELEWRQPSAFAMEYELHSGNLVIASLKFRSSFKSFATAQSEDGCWTFDRSGLFRPAVTIRECGSDQDIGRFQHNSWGTGGTLELPDHGSFPASMNFWHSALEFRNAKEEPLVRFQLGGILHSAAKVQIEPAARRLAELPLFVLLGWYVAILLRRDSVAIVT